MATAIEIHHLWKKFKVKHNRSYALKAKFLSIFYPRYREFKEEFWVLKDINFSVKKGESLGLIGLNGAGKSTLLYLIAKTIYPNKGHITVNGLVSPMIELGLGFSHEMNGIENIFLNMSLYGLTRRQINPLVDSIIDFSELGDFIDTPIKNYSSGMAARLGFSIAVHLDPEILLLDEIFAVGDPFFQKKCVDKMKEFKDMKKTIIFVSHSMDAIKLLCDRTCLLAKGDVVKIGHTNEVIDIFTNI